MATVLVVDDDPDIRSFVSLALGMNGYDVREACNGSAALAALNNWRPDAILLDLNMPIMDGWAFCREQLRRPALASIPIALMTAGWRPGGRAQPFNTVSVLEKPFELSSLLSTVDDAVRTRHHAADR
jgi:CheY-like chemotaxis protein